MGKSKKGLIPVLLIFVFIFFMIITISQRVYSKSNVEETFRKLDNKAEEHRVVKNNDINDVKKEEVEAEKERDKSINKEERRISKEGGKNTKTAYLTFDDGPSNKVTPEVLDILKKYNVKASFFVLGNNADKNPKLLKRIREEGHAIYNHSYSHNYKDIYSRPENFINEIKRTDEVINGIIGKNNFKKIIRFPGGSFGKKRAEFRKAAADEGYIYIDWNAENGDGLKNNIPVKNLLNEFKKTLEGKNELVVLMHDSNTKTTTAKALPEAIEYLKSKGYNFSTLEDYEF